MSSLLQICYAGEGSVLSNTERGSNRSCLGLLLRGCSTWINYQTLTLVSEGKERLSLKRGEWLPGSGERATLDPSFTAAIPWGPQDLVDLLVFRLSPPFIPYCFLSSIYSFWYASISCRGVQGEDESHLTRKAVTSGPLLKSAHTIGISYPSPGKMRGTACPNEVRDNEYKVSQWTFQVLQAQKVFIRDGNIMGSIWKSMGTGVTLES